jgi:hypothetical protein
VGIRVRAKDGNGGIATGLRAGRIQARWNTLRALRVLKGAVMADDHRGLLLGILDAIGC